MKARTRRKKWSYRRLMYWVDSFLSQGNIAQCQFWKDGYLVEGPNFPESDWRSRSKGVTAWFEPSSETKGQSVGPGEKARRKFSSTGGKAPRYRLSPNHKRSSECWLLIGHRKWFALLCPIGEQFLLSSFREFVHDCYYLATVSLFVHQAFLTRNEGTTDESKNVSDTISRSNSICTEEILFLTDHNIS